MFTIGTRVAWSHQLAPKHAAGSILRAAAVRAEDADARFGTITKVDVAPAVAGGETPIAAVGRPGVFEVALDGADGEAADVRELTADELVAVAAA